MIDIPAEAGRYTLTAEPLDSQEARLNGEVLALGSDDALPALQPARAEPGTLELAPASITFLTFEAARNGNCP
jgi:heparanase 1